jgi:hypothetical protein
VPILAPKTFVDKASKATEETGSIPPAMNDQVIVASALNKPGESAVVAFGAVGYRGFLLVQRASAACRAHSCGSSAVSTLARAVPLRLADRMR